jgi:CubicO group peptidase (beta-lactamase class C family)
MSAQFLEGIRGKLEGLLQDTVTPGATIAVVKDGKLLDTLALGYSDVAAKTPMTPENIVPIGSASKAFTAMSTAMLVSEGKVDLDKPMTDYVQGFRLSDDEAAGNATPRDLLCHRTGMPRHDLMWIGWDSMVRKDMVLNRLRHLKANKPFRSLWQYSNHMFATMGYLIECVTGQTWEDFVQARIFDPLGMKTGNFRVKYPDATGVFAKLYGKDEKDAFIEKKPLIIDAMGPAGSINATAADMAKWVIFHLNKGKVDGKELLSEAAFGQLFNVNIPYELYPFSFPHTIGVGYGLGWFVDVYRGRKEIHHGGNVDGASALVTMLPSENMGVVVLTNGDHTTFPTLAAKQIYDALLDYSDTDWSAFYKDTIKPFSDKSAEGAAKLVPEAIPGKGLTHAPEDYDGTYSHPGYGEITLRREGDTFIMKYHDTDFALRHLHYDVFAFEMLGIKLPMLVKTGADGKIAALEIQFEFALEEPSVFKKQ